MKDKLSALGLDGDMIEKVTEILKSEISDKYVPLSRFNEINDAKKKAEEDVASRDAQLETLKNASGDMEKLKKQIEELQADNLKAKQEYDAKLKIMRRDDFVKTTLMDAGLLDAKYIPGVSAYLPINELDVDSVASVDAFKAKLAEAKTIASSWFKTDAPPAKELGGLKLNDPTTKTPPGAEKYAEGSYEAILAKNGIIE